MASYGDGTCSIVPDQSPNLNEIVIRALSNSLQPGLKGCLMKWHHQERLEDLGSIARNQSIQSS